MRVAALVACVLAARGASAVAAEKTGRYTVDIRVDVQEQWRHGTDHSTFKALETYRIVTHVQSDGEAVSFNSKDPAYAEQQMARAARVQAAVQKAQGRQPAPAPTAESYAAAHQQLAARLEKERLACGTDTACLMALAMRVSQESAAIGMPGAAPGDAQAAEGGDDDGEARFLNYAGYEGCPTQIDIRIDQRSEGAYADVSGMIPWTVVSTASSKGSETDRMIQCLHATTVYDTKARTIYTDGFATPAIRGHRVAKDRLTGESVNDNAEVIGNAQALRWVSEQLRRAPASGTRSVVLTPDPVTRAPAGARLDGRIKVDLSWRFEP